MVTPYRAQLSVEQLQHFLDGAFSRNPNRVDEIGDGYTFVSRQTSEHHLRPGGTISGPTLMAMADSAAYAVILAHVGLQALAVTTSLHIDFLRKPPGGADLHARAELIKLGKRLAVCTVRLECSRGDEPPVLVAQANATYSLPPRG